VLKYLYLAGESGHVTVIEAVKHFFEAAIRYTEFHLFRTNAKYLTVTVMLSG
jgi:hypothetical protein